MEILTTCPVCSGTKFKSFLSCVDYTVSRETFTIVQCETCAFRFTNPRPDEKEIGKYYESEEYISHSGTSRGVVNKIYGIVRNYTIGQKVKLINKQNQTPNTKPRTILDIGCGTGEFLNACKQNRWSVTGIEPSDVARKHAKENFGIEPLSPEKLFEINEKKFNVITMWHVLEHVHQLHKTIEQINKILVDDGTLIIAVPNCNSFDAGKYGSQWAAYDVPRHIYHFTKNDIEKLFLRFGFGLKQVLPMKFDSYYVSLLSEKYKTGKSNLLAGFFSGLKSNLNAGGDRGYSSQIYILQKNK
jgi:2-polyprenyl-3-methyl-5-hydroxy-6-metoxy-1,4-benzoquinol methylase